MIHWKNKSLDNLSNSELKLALGEAINMSFGQKNHTQNNDIFSTFVFGVVTGVAIGLAGSFISLI